MTQLVSIEQAARNALATWLSTQLAVPDLVIEPRWFPADLDLPPKALSVIDAGLPDVEWLDAELLLKANVDTENGSPVKKVDVVWGFGHIDQAVQLDVWAPTEVELDDLRARLVGPLNAGDRGLGLTRVDPFAVGLRLPLGDGWDPGIVTFLFELPNTDQTSSSVSESEWHATYRGRASMQMTQRARSARIARILLQQRIYQRDPVETADPPTVTTITVTDT